MPRLVPGSGDAQPALPVRLACVDMGSNAIRFVVAEFAGEREWTVLASERSPVRLGHGVYLSGRLDGAAMDAAVAALAGFRTTMDELDVLAYRAVATSAVRESRNGAEFTERLENEARIELDVISGSEEARLVHLAVASRVPLGDRRWIMVDLGGGSVEVSLVDGSGILWSESHTMGSVRLLEELTEAGAEPGRFQRLLREYVATLKLPSAAGHLDVAGYIATGGNIEELARLAAARSVEGTSVLPTDDLRAVIDRLVRTSFRQRVDELGLREDRADVILPAAVVYERLAELAYANEILVPHVGIKEGILLDLFADTVQLGGREDRQEREVLAGALALGRKYMFDEAHGSHVATLALSLFDQLAKPLGLARGDRKLLQAAALLHDIGQFVSYRAHHKHSLYLIGYSELPNFSEHEMLLVANVARYHRKSEPSSGHLMFTQLDGDEQRRVSGLAGVLRLADALDREHVQNVLQVKASVTDQEVVLTLEGRGDLLLEGWSLKRRAQMFSSVFGRKVRFRVAESGS